MKKLTALALILLLLLSLTACAAEPQQAVGLSLEEAGLTAEFPFTPIVPDYRGDKPLDYEIEADISFHHHTKADVIDAPLMELGKLTAAGKASSLYMTWRETHGEETLPLSATIGHYQAYRKSDLEAGKIIEVSFTLKQGQRFADIPSEPTYTVRLDKKNVQSSYHFVAETEDYYIFDWFTLVVGDQPNDYKDLLFEHHFRRRSGFSYNASEYAIYEDTLLSTMNLKGNIKFVSK